MLGDFAQAKGAATDGGETRTFRNRGFQGGVVFREARSNSS